jgi:hypothetical protein
MSQIDPQPGNRRHLNGRPQPGQERAMNVPGAGIPEGGGGCTGKVKEPLPPIAKAAVKFPGQFRFTLPPEAQVTEIAEAEVDANEPLPPA